MSSRRCSSPARPAASRSRMPSSPASSTWAAPRWRISSASSSRCARFPHPALPRKRGRAGWGFGENLMALIQYLTRIQFDFGALALLPAELALLGVKRPLLVTDPGIRASDLFARVADKLPPGHVVYDKTPAN